ncbi:MAG: CHAT domain-containing protein [Pseudonocardiales bacterium]
MRDRLLAALTARLERIQAAQDPALALEPGALDDAQRLIGILRDDDGDVEARFILGWFYWYRHLALPEGPDRDALREASQALIPCFIAGVEGLPEPLLPLLAENTVGVAVALLKQAESTSDLTLITATVLVWQRVLNAISADHPNRAGLQANLGSALLLRFWRSGELADVDEAITVSRMATQATPAGHPERAGYLNNLGNALQARFGRVGALTDLDEAITSKRGAVQATPADHPDRPAVLVNLCSALRVRFGRMGMLADLDEAIILSRAAVQATPLDHYDRPAILANLGLALWTRFELAGALADLDEAITVDRAAVQAAPADHPNWVMYLSNLASSLLVRFRRVGALADLDGAIAATRAVMQATPDDHSYQARNLANLGAALWTRFERAGAPADLDEAITVIRSGMQAISVDHPERAIYLSNLGAALRARFELAGVLADLDESITIGQAGVQVTPIDHPRRAMHLSNLGLALRTRFERVEVPADLDEAITIARAVIQATPVDHPDRAKYLSNLAATLQTRFERAGVQADLDEAITTLALAAEGESGAASVRIRAARVAASLSAQTDPRGAAELLAGAVRLLPKTTPRQFQHGDQQYALGQFAGLAGDAAALALLADVVGPSGENPAMQALRLLELGRGVLLSQALDTRSDLTDLQAGHPELAERFIELRDQLDQPGDTSVLADEAGMAAGWEERCIEDRHQLAAAFETTVAGIRDLDGFETFLLPPEPDQLIRHAQHGPVVVVNVSQYRSDAILLTPAGAAAVPLPGLAWDDLSDRIISFHQALRTAHDPEVSSADRIGAQHTLSAVLEWLWDVTAQPVLDELGHQETPAPGTAWPQLWWVLGGRLGFLPLHAAGYHREPPRADGGRRTVMDRVISSYTPIVRALGYARERTSTSAVAKRALIVAMPTTPGDDPLHHVVNETELVRNRLPGATLLIESSATTDSELPTKATVLAHLGECAIVHFACHGRSHLTDPSQNLLLLHDHDTAPLTVASLAPIRLDQARLAYLSACRTAFNRSTNLIDEAIDLTTAFQLAGYPHVVGTLWEIDDALAANVADAFYTALAADNDTIDTRGAAQALHHAVRVIRDRLPATPSLWAAYLHAGA